MKILSTLMLLIGWPFMLVAVAVYVCASVSLAVVNSMIDIWARP